MTLVIARVYLFQDLRTGPFLDSSCTVLSEVVLDANPSLPASLTAPMSALIKLPRPGPAKVAIR